MQAISAVKSIFHLLDRFLDDGLPCSMLRMASNACTGIGVAQYRNVTFSIDTALAVSPGSLQCNIMLE